MPANHAERRERAAALLPAVNADALLVTKPVNVRYLTGLVSTNAALLLHADGTAALATDLRYIETARRVCADIRVVLERDTSGALARLADPARLAVEGHHMPVAEFLRIAEEGASAGAGAPEPVSGLVEGLRVVKDEEEIDLIRTACAITDQAFADVLGAIRPGVTEREIARMLEGRMLELGADRPAFDSIVAAGPNGAVPHHTPTDRPVAAGELVTMDFGALHAGYHADMTRTVAVGAPAGWQRELYDLVRAAQRAGRDAVKPGATVHDVDASAREVIETAGRGEHFGHGLGHGVGLEIHEVPFLGPGKPGRIEDRVPITVEPGVYLPGKGGVRIEDTLVARVDRPELLTHTTRELLIL
ncbi:Xaa-Pro peptidase family protein [Spongiactinospora sp. TRM90649]|uniref:M24 family metallopeptidase n=1 Tax=Spongiactinospora sp. TRM90649 TaxID=3031114 RepID=UPI0023F6E3DC|nr:Xaa-Pro peptidase family protein [Spongiactinospora sp. TRM90649]MDF5756845.1 Xaa-Pro peptidase family protein [Spongiactinospora sp. TRM90649]